MVVTSRKFFGCGGFFGSVGIGCRSKTRQKLFSPHVATVAHVPGHLFEKGRVYSYVLTDDMSSHGKGRPTHATTLCRHDRAV